MSVRETLIRWLGGSTAGTREQPTSVRVEPLIKTPPRDLRKIDVGPQPDNRRPRLQPEIKPNDWKKAAFKLADPAPGVLPKGKELDPEIRMAMDADPGQFQTWFGANYSSFAFIEGYTFLGYPYLSQLSQICEYRLISETLADEVTRKWITVKSKKDEAEKEKNNGKFGDNYKSAEDRITKIDDRMKDLGVREAIKTLVAQDGFFGRSHLYIDTGVDFNDPSGLLELKTDLGDGDDVSKVKLKKGTLRALKTVEPVWCYPSVYNSTNPLTDSWYRPDIWFVMGMEVHRSRLLTMVARPVPDLFKPAFSFGGLSLTQMVKPYVDNWLQTRQSVNDIIHSFSTPVLQTDMQQFAQTGQAVSMDNRIRLFNNNRDNNGVMVLDKQNEDFKIAAVPLSSLPELQAQSQEHICAAAQMPLVKFTGISPSGLNASSEGELDVYDDRNHAFQEAVVRHPLDTIFKLIQLDVYGKVDDDLYYEFNPLREMNEKEKAEINKLEMEADKTGIDSGALDPLDVRRRIAKKSDGPYAGIDAEDVPEVETPEPGNIRERVDEDEDDDTTKEAA